MIKRPSLSLFALGVMLSPAWAQPAPFDMTPESDLRTPAPAPVETSPVETVPSVPVVQPFARYIVPEPSVRLEGEESRASMVVYLTQAQAEAPVRFEFGYLNSLVVAPEVSSLRVRLNQTEISSTPLAASSSGATRSIEVPPGLLRAGPNIVEFRALERHRTDCSVASTYELWTQIDSTASRLVFQGEGLSQLTELSDLPAVGVDASGVTRVRLISSSLADPQAATAAVRLAQHLALALRVPELIIEPADALSEAFAVGVLDVVVMPASELPADLAQARGSAEAGPLAALLTLPSGANTLVVSGPDWPSIQRAGEALYTGEAAQAALPRIDLAVPHPMMLGGQSISLSDLSMETAEFNGRRLTTNFQFELPADFYAYRYGELDLVLDAAYSADVLPGSEIDVYTNGQIASATPLLRTDGGQLRDSVIRIPMTNLRPGRNEGVIAVNLLSASDETCSAGWTGQAPVRFVLSNSSQLRFPDYARAGIVPDLQVLTGTGWPYADAASVPLVVGSSEDAVLSAMMFSARIASASGRILPFTVTDAAELSPDSDGLVVMPLSEMPPPLMSRSGVASGGSARSASDPALDRFSGDSQGNFLTAPAEWVLQGLGMQLTDLRPFPPADAPYPASPNSAVVSQVRQSEGGLWTVLTASDNTVLRTGTERLVVTERWREIGGRVSALAPADDAVSVVQANRPIVVDTQPFSLANLRLMAANWFSGNLLYFSAAVLAVAALLTMASSFVLSQWGRR